MALEVIDGGVDREPVEIPADAPERALYPIATDRPQPLLTAVPGDPFRQVNPMPETVAWWKIPFYVALGLPRDLADAVFGAASYVPLVNLPTVYVAYEVVPTQALMRDPRDWHRWPGERNARGHGMVDGDSWGWFSSLNSWHFKHPSARKQRANIARNEALQAELTALNRAIEERNRPIIRQQREARARALEAIAAGQGREAVARMLPFLGSPVMDEGAFAIWATALAEYASSGPQWVRRLLWSQLANAQPRNLAQAENLLAGAAERHPTNRILVEALVYARLLAEQPAEALADTRRLIVGDGSGDARGWRLLFETALAARDAESARQALAAMTPANYPAGGWDLLNVRLQLLSGQVEPALATLRRFQVDQPSDAYLNYFMGCAWLLRAAGQPNPVPDYRDAFAALDRAVLLAPASALRIRATAALSYVRGVLSRLGESPDLLSPPAADRR